MSPEIIYLIGVAACGKSTYCEKLLKSNPEKNFQIVSTDTIIEENARAWGMTYFQAIMSMSEENTHDRLILPLVEAIQNKRNIIVDRTNMNLRSRDFTMKYLTDDYIRNGVVFNVSMDNIRYRLRRREFKTGKHIPEIVVERMYKSFQFPYGREFHNIEMVYS